MGFSTKGRELHSYIWPAKGGFGLDGFARYTRVNHQGKEQCDNLLIVSIEVKGQAK